MAIPDANTVIQNLNSNLFPLLKFITAAGYVGGVFLIAKGMFKLRKVGDYRSMMYQPVDIFPPITMILCGAMLLWLPAIFQTVTETIFNGSDGLLSYNAVQGDGEMSIYTKLAVNALQVIGIGSFIRGWFILAKSNEAQAQGGMSRGFIHVVAGVLCYHVYPFYEVIKSTLGIT